jgi:hypothetical protein
MWVEGVSVPPYSNNNATNRNAKVWRGATENGP